MDIPRLKEQLKTIRNLCEISLLVTDRPPLLPSILEVIYYEAQNMVETQCIVEESSQ